MGFNAAPVWVSIETSVAATAITFFLGLTAANWRVRSTRKRGQAMDALFIVPLVLPPTVVGYLLLLLLGRTSPVGREIQDLGFNVLFTWPATVIAATVVAFPLMYLSARGAFEQVNPSYLQAARTLGAPEWTVFWKVMLPLAWPGVLAGAILAFARALGEFGATLMIAGNIPGRTQTLPIAIFFAAEGGNMRQALAWVLITLGVASVAIAAFNTWGRKQAFSFPGGQKA
ncbi:MAG: molybdate ABC transporter permease subunit [Acidobacteriota bacterium]|nr:molybdate ABC transporter permease subunit [Acidobacteriota bacterium]